MLQESQSPPGPPSQPDSMMPSMATRFFDSSNSATLERSTITSQVATNGGFILNMTQASSSSERLSQPSSNATDEQADSQQSCSHHDHAEPNNKTRAQVYFDCLLSEKRGSPLYIPSPDRNLPKEYRRDGVRPGDVIVINNDGGVSYFFNVFASADDPVNRGRVPPSFQPFPKHLARVETYPYCTDVVMSSSIRSSGSNLGFETSREGALVVMPSGANLTRLANTKRFDKYLGRHLESWYHFVLSEGVPIENGDIRLVVGCDKTTNWGMATFFSQERIGGQVVFQRRGSDCDPDYFRYASQCSGSAAAQTGPKAAELNDLREPGSNEPIENQCLFLRTLNPQLSDVLFDEISQRVEAEYFEDWDTVLEPKVGNVSTSSSIHQLDSNRVLPGSTPKASMNHPSSGINKSVLSKFPSAKMVITEDNDWASVVTKDERFPCAHEVVKRMEENYTFSEKNGIVTITPLDTTSTAQINDVNLDDPQQETIDTIHHRNADAITPTPDECFFEELSRDLQNIDLCTSGASIHPSISFTWREPGTLTKHTQQQQGGRFPPKAGRPMSSITRSQILQGPPIPSVPDFPDLKASPSLLFSCPPILDPLIIFNPGQDRCYLDSPSLPCDTDKTRDVSELLQSLYTRIEDVKIQKEKCRELSDRCGQLLLSLQAASDDVDEAHPSALTDDLKVAVERIHGRVSDWTTWSRLKSFLRQDDIKHDLEQFERVLDDAIMKIKIRSIPPSRDNLSLSTRMVAVISRSRYKRLRDHRQEQSSFEDKSPTLGNLTWLNASEEATASSQPLVAVGSFNSLYKGTWPDQKNKPSRRRRLLCQISLSQREIATMMGEYASPSGGSRIPVSPWTPSGSVMGHLRENSQVDSLKLLTEIASGLEYLHTKTIVHGNLRATNVVVSRAGVAQVSDFGISTYFDDRDRKPAVRMPSVRWTAPEILQGDARASTSSDVWSFGMVCYELLAGKHPFEDEDDELVFRMLTNCRIPERPRRASESSIIGLWKLMQQCWSPYPSSRPSVTSVKAKLLDFRKVNSLAISTATFPCQCFNI